jgi:hypothetical protein
MRQTLHRRASRRLSVRNGPFLEVTPDTREDPPPPLIQSPTEFEASVARAFDGVALRQSTETLNAAQFLQVLNDLSTFAVEPWDTENHRTTSSSEQHSRQLSSQCSHLFDYRRPRRNTFSRRVTQRLTLNRIADPAMRRAALWLVTQVIWLHPTPRPRHALRLGFSAQDEFFGKGHTTAGPGERTTAAALSGIGPDASSWGTLSSDEFLMILTDLTTWSLTHFEPVRFWSAAEYLTPAEEQAGYGLIGRIRRMSASEYGEQRMTRTLRTVAHPKLRGAALWAAQAFMATCHIAASDRPSGRTTQDCQAAWLSRSSPAARQWLALRQNSWPPSYRRERWTDVREFT